MKRVGKWRVAGRERDEGVMGRRKKRCKKERKDENRKKKMSRE